MPGIDTASLVVQASPPSVYRAFVDPDALIAWLPPKGMSGSIEAYDATPVAEGTLVTVACE
ncbi:MAG TPA: hypothetical protein VEZ72_12470, partial [Paenibacillus sp.]|nr:hypothetical protein [Paenibacillus sp.]